MFDLLRAENTTYGSYLHKYKVCKYVGSSHMTDKEKNLLIVYLLMISFLMK